MNLKNIVSVLVLILFVLKLEAKDIYVAKDGDDNNSGTLESPYLTLLFLRPLSR